MRIISIIILLLPLIIQSVVIKNCSDGESFSIEQHKCVSCPIGRYSNSRTHYMCINCPLYKTTYALGAFKLSHCTYLNNLRRKDLTNRYSVNEFYFDDAYKSGGNFENVNPKKIRT